MNNCSCYRSQGGWHKEVVIMFEFTKDEILLRAFSSVRRKAKPYT